MSTGSVIGGIGIVLALFALIAYLFSGDGGRT